MNVSPERFGPYRIQRSIGKGGFGEVFAAVDEYTGQIVALKVLLPEVVKDAAVVARFIGEARALAALHKHPGVVTVYRFDKTADGVPYLAMELLDGKTLRNWLCERECTISLDAALTIGQQVANIMVDVHAQGFVHRDLKPENIMLVADERSSLGVRPILLDFGIAKVTVQAPFDDQSPTRVITAGIDVLGSVVYMAPEQFINAGEINEKADVYVLGLVVYELIAGKPPFQSNEPIELILMHGRDIPKNLDEIVQSVPPKLATFVASMLAKAPEDRPSMSDCRDMFARDWSHEDIDCPFPGLLPFKDSQAHLFFGRRAETLAISANLDEIHEGTSRRWLQIQGPSGTGKSSLVHAAILPALMKSQQWRVITMRPAEDPIRSMATAFAMAYEKNEADVVSAFRASSAALDVFVKEHHLGETKLLLVIDQFEELFALGGALRPAFEALIAKAFENVDSRLRLLTTIRSDYLHRFDQALGLARLLDEHALRYDLRPMDEAALAEVIDGMAGRAGLRLSEGLPRKMVQDASGTDCRLPLLGHTLRSLWSYRSGGAITHEHYEQTGGVGGALAKHAEQLVEGLGDEGKQRAKWLVLDLVRVGRGAPDTRRPRTRAELIDVARGDKLAEDVLMRLSGVTTNGSETEPFRLVVISGNALDPNRQTVDLVHEMVLQKVPVVVGWINEERELLERLVTLEGAANAWVDAGRPKNGLPFGSLLDHYRGGKNAAQRERLERMASAEAREFLGEAIRQQRRRTWMLRGFGAAMVVAVVAIVVSAVVAVQARERAEKNLTAMLKATDTIVHELDWELSWRFGTLDTRESTLRDLDKKLEPFGISDPEVVRVAIVETKHRRSDLARTHRTLGEAYELLVQAHGWIDAGTAEGPPNVDRSKLEAMYLSKHGKLMLAERKWQGARSEFGRSIALLEDVHNGSIEYDSMLATSCIERADAELREDASKAVPWYDKAIALRRRVAKEQQDSYFNSLVGDALVHRGHAALMLERTVDARKIFQEALQLQAPITTSEPHNMFFQLSLVRIHLGLAGVHAADGRWPEARELYGFARDKGEMLHAGDPEHKEYALALGDALDGLEKAGKQVKDTELFDMAHKRRCEVMKKFVEKDSRDKRFDATGCK